MPGSLDNSKSLGTNIMIKKGAKLVTNIEDITKNFEFLKKRKEISKIEDEVNEEYKDIYELINDVPIDINLICKYTNIDISEIMEKITMLEIDGKIKRVGGNRVVRF